VAHDLSVLEAIGVGLLQGVAVVFPISGLGHGVLAGALGDGVGADLAPDHARYLYASLRVAVGVALLVYYWRDWLHVLRGLGGAVARRGSPDERRWAGLLLLAAVPACVAVALLAGRVRPLLGHPRLAAAALIVNGALMLVTWWWWRRSPRAGGMSGTHRAPLSRAERAQTFVVELSTLRPARAVVLGLMPLGALVPGISGIALTLAAALALGLTHEQAAHVALLLMTPFLIVWGLAELPDLGTSAYDHVRSHLALAAVLALGAAYLTAALLVRYFQRASLRPFAYYCVLAGAASLVALTVT
jgi:undecaprenyl-diphosphatase